MNTHTHQYPADTIAGLNARVLSTQPTTALLKALASVSGALCLHAAGACQTAWHRHTSRNELQELNERTLDDVGLRKDQVETEWRKWFWQD